MKRTIPALACFAVAVGANSFASAQSRLGELSLCVDGVLSHVPDTAMHEATRLASDAFAAARIRLHWAVAVSGERVKGEACAPEEPRVSLVAIRHVPRNRNGAAMGETFFHTEREPIVQVYYDPVERFARRSHVPAPALLGYVLVHELAHALMGTLTHSDSGLMAPSWRPQDLTQIVFRKLRFENEDIRAMQAALARQVAVSVRSPSARQELYLRQTPSLCPQ